MSPLARKDLVLFTRRSKMGALLGVAAFLLAVSVFTGLQRTHVEEKERAAALAADRAVWVNQGERNPHSAAHFSRYAFRPGAPLAMLDPGTTAFSGLAIWMEAHVQDPAVFRAAEDGGELSRYAGLTPAFLFVVLGPLVAIVMLFGSVAGEREDGTLRQVLACGVTPQDFFRGKLSAASSLAWFVYTGLFAPLAIATLLATPTSLDADSALRLGLLYLVFGIYLSTFVAIAIGASALFRTRQAAFLGMIGLWAVLVILLPRFAADFSLQVHPQPDAREAAAALGDASYVYYRDEALQEQVKADVLERYGVSDVEALPIDFNAYVLQASEDLAEPRFDRFYGELDALYLRQERNSRWFALATPVISVTRLSSGLAATDRHHQRHFAQAAERHRRDMVQILNEDYMYNAGDQGAAYTADSELWGRFTDLDAPVPGLPQVARQYLADGLVLMLWLVIGTIGAFVTVRRAIRQEAPTV